VVKEQTSGKKSKTNWKMFVPLMFIPIFTITDFGLSVHNYNAVQSANKQKIEATHSVQRIYEDWQRIPFTEIVVQDKECDS